MRARVEARLYQLLTQGITLQQKDQLQRLLLVPEGDRVSLLDQIRPKTAGISWSGFLPYYFIADSTRWRLKSLSRCRILSGDGKD